jgi:hypothetical protein
MTPFSSVSLIPSLDVSHIEENIKLFCKLLFEELYLFEGIGCFAVVPAGELKGIMLALLDDSI